MGYIENKKIKYQKMLKHWLKSEYWGAQWIYENFRTKETPTGYLRRNS